MNKKITLANSAGFCFGVDRAVNIVYTLLEQGKKVCTLGPIIHNPQLVKQLSDKGVIIVNEPSETPDGYTLVIRSHGVPKLVLEDIRENSIDFVDATCPFVSKIHKIAENCGDKLLLVAGDESHAEIAGIVGYAKNYHVFANEEQLLKILENPCINVENSVSVVAQTTFNTEIFKKCKEIIKKGYTNAVFFDTICDATSIRQNELKSLAHHNDLMVIIGGRQSSNTRKLYEISKDITKTVLIETAEELNPADFKEVKRIGVTAGASTPAEIIKEVLRFMNEILEENEVLTAEPVENTPDATDISVEVAAAESEVELDNDIVLDNIKSFDEMTYEEALQASLDGLNQDQRVKGTVLAVGPTEVQVDIGRKQAGYIPADELSADTTLTPDQVVKKGDVIDLIIMKTNDVEGITTLSKRRFDATRGFEKIKEAEENGTFLEGTVTQVIKGGVMVISDGIRVFIPASHATVSRDDSLEDLVGKEVKYKVLEIGFKRRVVGSIRASLREARKEAEQKAWDDIAIGNKYTGKVKSLTSYGAFVDIGGVDGMVHITELSWRRIKHPSDIIAIGDEIEVYIKGLDTEKRKISLGYRKAEDNPWNKFRETYNIGDTLEAKIVSMTAFGAFANIMENVDGLIHISQIANKRIAKPQDELKIGDVVNVKIIGIDSERKRISLSIRALLEPEVKEETASAVSEETVENEVIASVSDEATDIPEEILTEEPAIEIIEEVEVVMPVVEKVTVEEAIAEEVAIEETIIEEASVEEVVVENAVVEEAVAEEVATEEAATEEAIVEETIVEEPIVEEIVAEEPVSKEPAVESAEETAVECTCTEACANGNNPDCTCECPECNCREPKTEEPVSEQPIEDTKDEVTESKEATE